MTRKQAQRREQQIGLHQERYLLWESGMTVSDIAEGEGITVHAVYCSLRLCRRHLPPREIHAAFHRRWMARLASECCRVLELPDPWMEAIAAAAYEFHTDLPIVESHRAANRQRREQVHQRRLRLCVSLGVNEAG